MEVLVVGASGQLAPPGVPGEIHVAGVGVASGYINQPELTRDRFVPNPFGEPGGSPTMYRTGDIGRWSSTGQLEYLGRSDDQVKIRGARVELGEVEAALEIHPEVAQVSVIVETGTAGPDSRLIAFVTPKGQDAEPQRIRNDLAEVLPDFMVPSVVHVLDDLPRNPSGKVDRKALVDLQKDMRSSATMPQLPTEAATDLETQMLDTWSEVTNLPNIGLDSDFFEIGGHSLMAIRLFSEIKSRTDVSLPLSLLLRTATPRTLAAELQRRIQTESGVVAEARQSDGLRHVVHLRPDSEAPQGRPNLFIVHGAGGNVLNLRELASELTSEFNVFGVKAAGADDFGSAHQSIQEMVSAYESEIRRVQPKGRTTCRGFPLAGWLPMSWR